MIDDENSKDVGRALMAANFLESGRDIPEEASFKLKRTDFYGGSEEKK